MLTGYSSMGSENKYRIQTDDLLSFSLPGFEIIVSLHLCIDQSDKDQHRWRKNEKFRNFKFKTNFCMIIVIN